MNNTNGNCTATLKSEITVTAISNISTTTATYCTFTQ